MSSLTKQIMKIAQSDMSRKAFGHWEVFALPEANPRIDRLLAKLAEKDAAMGRTRSGPRRQGRRRGRTIQ